MLTIVVSTVYRAAPPYAEVSLEHPSNSRGRWTALLPPTLSVPLDSSSGYDVLFHGAVAEPSLLSRRSLPDWFPAKAESVGKLGLGGGRHGGVAGGRHGGVAGGSRGDGGGNGGGVEGGVRGGGRGGEGGCDGGAGGGRGGGGEAAG